MLNINIIMSNLIVDATGDKVFLTLIVDKNIYTCSHENSKINFEKLIILINDFLKGNKSSLSKIKVIYVNRGPGSFAGIRNSLSTIKALFLTKHEFKGGKARYEELNEGHHDHLIDVKSGEIIEFVDEEIEKLQEKIADKYGYKLVDHKLELYGVKKKTLT